jgi:uncharacterized protein (DUF433 family)
VPSSEISALASGAYTLPDAAKILNLPIEKLRRWVVGYTLSESKERRYPMGSLLVEESGRDRHLNFLTLIEVFTIAELRNLGVGATTLRKNREELSRLHHTEFPFALEGLLVNGKNMLHELGNEVLLELGSNGQQAFEQILVPFCKRIDFDHHTRLAERYFPLGVNRLVVVDPKHSFGRPVVFGTNITTENLFYLHTSGESPEDLANEYELSLNQVTAAIEFEGRKAA